MNATATPSSPKLVPANGQPVTMLEIVEHEAPAIGLGETKWASFSPDRWIGWRN